MGWNLIVRKCARKIILILRQFSEKKLCIILKLILKFLNDFDEKIDHNGSTLSFLYLKEDNFITKFKVIFSS